jgi:predicted dehydrogenase
MGRQGTGCNLRTFLQHPDAVALAVCDVKLSAARKAKEIVDKAYETKDCQMCQDFRDVITRDDLDAIVISTPDHWHVPLSLAALRAGKDVFTEKPTLTIAEGRELAREVAECKAVFQWGIEDRSLLKYHCLAGWARCGAIGTLQRIEVSLPTRQPYPKDEPAPVPDDLDWNLWLGPAPFREYTPTLSHADNWRNVTDYSGGSLTDWGAHLVDTAQVGAGFDDSGPVEVSGTGDVADPNKYQSDVAIHYKLRYQFANGIEMFVQDDAPDIKFIGDNGWVRCEGWNGSWSASSETILRQREFGGQKGYWERPQMEQRNFLDSIKSRKPTTYHAEAGHRLSTTLHLGHLAIRSGRTIRWDPVNEAFPEEDTDSPQSIIYRRAARDWASA